MNQDLLLFNSNERIDQRDLNALVQTQLGLQADLLGNFATDAGQPGTTPKMWVIKGFNSTFGAGSASGSPVQNQVTITPGVVFGGMRLSTTEIRYGVIGCFVGSTAQELDFSQYASATYVLYARLLYSPSGLSNRKFWNSAGTGSEYTQIAPTRLSASMQVTAAPTGQNPGDEYFPVAQVNWTAPTTQGGSGSFSAIQDVRQLYFEGKPSGTTAFASTWGTSNDRSADRSTYGVTNLHTFVNAVKTCLEDIKGPGLRRWWDPVIGGMNLNFAASPVAGRLALGDAKFFLQGDPLVPTFALDQAAGGGYDGFVLTRGAGNANGRLEYRQKTLAKALTIGPNGHLLLGNEAPSSSLSSLHITHDGLNTAAVRVESSTVNTDILFRLVTRPASGKAAYLQYANNSANSEVLMYQLGMAPDDNFLLEDRANLFNPLRYGYADRSFEFRCNSFRVINQANNASALFYSNATGITSIPGPLTAGNSIVGSLNVTDAGANALVVTGTTVPLGGITAASTATLQQFNVLGTPALFTSNRMVVGRSNGVPPGDPPVGTIYFDLDKGNFYGRISTTGGSDDGLTTPGWRRLASFSVTSP